MEFQCFEIQIKTEADSNECAHDEKPSTGMFAVSNSRGLIVTSCAKFHLTYFHRTVCTMLKCVLYSLHSTVSEDNLRRNCVVVYNK